MASPLNQELLTGVADIHADIDFSGEVLLDKNSVAFKTLQVTKLREYDIPACIRDGKLCTSTGKLHWDWDTVRHATLIRCLWTPDVNKFPNCFCKQCCDELDVTQAQRQLQVISELHLIDNGTRSEAALLVNQYDAQDRHYQEQQTSAQRQLTRNAITRLQLSCRQAYYNADRIQRRLAGLEGVSFELASSGILTVHFNNEYFVFPTTEQRPIFSERQLAERQLAAQVENRAKLDLLREQIKALESNETQKIEVEDINKKRDVRLTD